MTSSDPVTVMTQREHDEYVTGGCDPHCHACTRKISVGDQWALKVFVPEATGPTGLVLRVRGMCCEECVRTDRNLPATERAALAARLRAAMTPPASPKPPSAPAVAGRGCFVLDDGTKF
jgi:hypothetical protein